MDHGLLVICCTWYKNPWHLVGGMLSVEASLELSLPGNCICWSDDHNRGVALREQVFPGRTDETYPVPLTRVVYIAAEDFREVDSKGYYALAPQKEVMLK